VIEAVVVLTTIGLAVALPSAPEFRPCGNPCPDPVPNGDPHRFALRLVIVVVGTLVVAFVDTRRPSLPRNMGNGNVQPPTAHESRDDA
jgi:hypothetical protein